MAGLLGALGSIGATIFGGISASKAMKNVRRNIEAQRKKNKEWYDRRYNEDATQRADAQAMITKTAEAMRQRSRQQAGAQAVMGATEEAAAAQKAADSQAMADLASNITASAEARKDALENQYMAQDTALQNQLNNMEINRAQGVAQAAGEVGKAAAGMFG